jgi:hypothetical protein
MGKIYILAVIGVAAMVAVIFIGLLYQQIPLG